MIRILRTAALLCCAIALPASAQAADDLRCIDDQLDQGQRAAIAALFSEQTNDPAEKRKFSVGSVFAASDFAVAIGGCANRFNWNDAQRQLAEEYLMKLGAVGQLHVEQGEIWGAAMDSYAPFGLRLLPQDKEPTEHQRAMIVAGAHANGVPMQAKDEDTKSVIIDYLQRVAQLDAAKRAFYSAF